MAPLDDMSGERVLAEFEAMIRGTGGYDPGRHGDDESRGLVPERRAVNWVNALAALAREIEQRQGPHRAEALLRTVGARMSRELLSPLPKARDEFEPAINRALSILDWGWVAVLDRQDTIVFEHRTPWPFEKRLDHLPFVLEGFYGDTLLRLSENAKMQVRQTGSRGGALVFKWLPADAPEAAAQTQAPSVIVPAPAPPAPTVVASDDDVAPLTAEEVILAAELEDVALDEAPRDIGMAPPAPAEDLRPPPTMATHRPRQVREPPMPLMPQRVPDRARPGNGRAMLVAATVFIVLFVLGIMSTGDTIGSVTHRLTQLVAAAGGTRTASDLEKRALSGDTDAQIRLGLQLANGADAKPDYAGAARWFEAAAKTGSLEAQYDLGVMTTDGLGVKRDPVGAAILFMNAAAGGFPQAEYRIGLAYRDGIGVPRSANFAAMWYERAARHGVRQAQSALAALYAAGEGLPADPVMAFAWYRLAEEEGDRAATAKRIEVYRGLSAAQREAAMNQAKVLIGDVSGGSALVPGAAHPTVDRLIAQIS